MNKSRRIILTRAVDGLEGIKNTVETCKDEEEQAYENLPESIQSSERGEAMYESVDSLTEAVDNIDDAITNICNAIGNG
jgi:adenylosuccinate synthase